MICNDKDTDGQERVIVNIVVVCCPDASLHSVFAQLDGPTALVDLIKSAVRIPTDSAIQMVCSVVMYL